METIGENPTKQAGCDDDTDECGRSLGLTFYRINKLSEKVKGVIRGPSLWNDAGIEKLNAKVPNLQMGALMAMESQSSLKSAD